MNKKGAQPEKRLQLDSRGIFTNARF